MSHPSHPAASDLGHLPLCSTGHTPAVQLLLERKADPAATDRRGQTAGDVCKDPELKALLAAALAQREESTAGSEHLPQHELCGLFAGCC
jgi:hypothetical protein